MLEIIVRINTHPAEFLSLIHSTLYECYKLHK